MNEDRHYTHLVCNARSPLISCGKLRDELLLYNLSSPAISALIDHFADLTGKRIGVDSETKNLSGGQKVLLMCLLAIYSPARSILFIGLWHSLDEQNRLSVQKLLAGEGLGKEIITEDFCAED